MPRFGRVVLGGTFDRLHVGHEALLATAFRVGRGVAIGVTTERYLQAHPKPGGPCIQRYTTRRAALRRWLSARYPRRRWTLTPLNNTFGGSVEAGVDALVVSADSVPGGRAVNVERRRLGRRPVPMLVVPLVLADDLRPVSSRRIRAGEIDRNGRRRGSIRVGLAVAEKKDRLPAARGIRRAFPRARVDVVPFPATARRSELAVRAAASVAARNADLGVAVDGRAPALERVAIASPWTVLDPQVISPSTSARLTVALAKLLRRSAESKPFNPRRK